MNTTEAIKSRRAIKEFDREHMMTESEEKELLSLAMLSPTAFNIQHWRFVVVKDKVLREQIKEAAWGQTQVTDSSLFIIICADTKSWEKSPARYWANTAKEVQEFMLPTIDGYYREKEEVQRDEAFRSCGIAAQTLMLAAKGMGYDSCPMDGFDFEKVAQLIRLPDDHIISMFVAIGKGTKPAQPRGGQLDMEDVVIRDRF
ncbi:Oxygen-insensitive NAD(P)H nitroreductase / Dihydropteridine reductase [hydrothermal vent metagenome]|uniref:Oxygen-insensitive NAD(P)H nitroreductase / Dihydropteridine reductase n=1 Tax=hydrothermal vent metagenome TaxID=652676 RepID=A0A3B1AXJ8_9ZZZZ